MSDDLRPDGRSIALIHDPLEFDDAPLFEHDTHNKYPDGRTGGDVGLDVSEERIWRMFRKHLILDLEDKPIAVALPQSTLVLQRHPQEGEPIAAESAQPTLVLQRHPQEGDPCPVPFDPLHLHQITLHGRGPIARIHLECQVLSTCEGSHEAESTPPDRDINHLPTGEPCLIRDDHAEHHTRSHRPSCLPPLFVVTLFGEAGQRDPPGEFLLHTQPPMMHEWISNSHAEGTRLIGIRIFAIFEWGRSLGADGVDRNRFGGEENNTAARLGKGLPHIGSPGLAFSRAVDAAEAKTLRVGVV